MAREQAASATNHGLRPRLAATESPVPTVFSNIANDAGMTSIPIDQVELMIQQAVAAALNGQTTAVAAPVKDVECVNCYQLTPDDNPCCGSCTFLHHRVATEEDRRSRQAQLRSERAAAAFDRTTDPQCVSSPKEVPAIQRGLARSNSIKSRFAQGKVQVTSRSAAAKPSTIRTLASFQPQPFSVPPRQPRQAHQPSQVHTPSPAAAPAEAAPAFIPAVSHPVSRHTDLSVCRKCQAKAHDMRDVIC